MERVVENKLIRDPYPNRTLFSKKEHSLLPRPFSYAHAREGKGWNLKKVLEFISSRCNTNFCPQVVLGTCTIRLPLPVCQYS